VAWIVANIHRIMILSGVLTMTMVYAALDSYDLAVRKSGTVTHAKPSRVS